MRYCAVLRGNFHGSSNKLLLYIILQSLWNIAGYVLLFFPLFARWCICQFSAFLFILPSVKSIQGRSLGGASGALPRALTSRGRKKGGHRPGTH
jgi:hypothetical protein